ncbi:uncharacterized protein LOC135815430 [Sycon ciliatum]|uniref:uncharacterized protein LOC135815430 n=1 Tax=Sycon ciliatum TaxID=27933 RepID=UPI0020AE0DAB|eukprot:scpid62722/ scgid30343/ 
MADENKLPAWLVLWLIVASPVVVWDASFLFTRPASLPGGDLHWLFSPYALYIEVDGRYADMSDTFGLAQAYMNVVEVVLSLATVALHFRRDRRARLLGLVTLMMTWWKTVAYMIQYMDICNGGDYLAKNTTMSLVFLFLIPNGLWLVFPLLGIISLWSSLHRSLAVADGKKAR